MTVEQREKVLPRVRQAGRFNSRWLRTIYLTRAEAMQLYQELVAEGKLSPGYDAPFLALGHIKMGVSGRHVYVLWRGKHGR
jgi:hypothetical protein